MTQFKNFNAAAYEAPSCEVFTAAVQSVLCASPTGEPFEEGTPWDGRGVWE